MAKKLKNNMSLTPREEQVMQILWSHGPLAVKDMLAYYPEPHPHVNTVSTVVRMLEERGLVWHENHGTTYRYYAVADKAAFRDRSLGNIIKGYFDNSYLNAVSTLVKDEKITVEQLRELIDMVERGNTDNQ